MRFNNTDYNEQWVLNLTLHEFIQHQRRCNAPETDEQLEFIYNTIKSYDNSRRNAKKI